MKLDILYGSESGNAEVLAEDFFTELESGFECSLSNLADLTPIDMTGDGLYLVICSTTGSGDVPAAVEDFLHALNTDKPDLSAVTFAIFGLGDRTYAETFNQGSEKVMNALIACGAQMVGDRGLHDASDADLPEDVAFPWFRGLPIQEPA